MESGEPLPRRDGRRGGWRAALFIVAVGFLERIGFTGVGGNLITYLTGPLGMSTAAAAAGVNAWSGTVLVLPLVGALAADSRLGRYRAVLIAGVLYLLVSASTNFAPSPVPSIFRASSMPRLDSLAIIAR
ncbi:unnamed protein product [Triticum turgidum subsp. durum]|uniref:MFS transporter n=1 Tax=Triticum turgidum subsp. durum TaxID=4567 RepID=A0A9R0VPD4_TRITD|nr:unnamed protein product [Triticum turgidum subsp. durum]